MQEGFRARQQVPEYDPEYRELRERHHADGFHDLVFGMADLKGIAQSEVELERYDESMEEAREHLVDYSQDVDTREELEFNKKLWNVKLRVRYTKLALRLLEGLQYNDPETKSMLDEAKLLVYPSSEHDRISSATGADASGDEEYTHCLQEIAQGKVDDEELQKRVLSYLESLEDKHLLLQQKAKEITQTFSTAVNERVENGTLPADAQHALARLDSIPAYLMDRFLSPENTGAMHGALGEVHVRTHLLDAGKEHRLEGSLMHEYMHEIAGTSNTIAYRTRSVGAILRKSGVEVQGKERVTLRWLNEAITEWLTLELRGEDGFGGGAYYEERQELKRLFDAGLSRGLVTNAYFENIHGEQSPDEKGQHFAALMNAINTIEGKHGVNKLENHFLMNEVDDVLRTCFLEPVDEGLEDTTSEHDPVRVSVRIGKDDNVMVTRVYGIVKWLLFVQRDDSDRSRLDFVKMKKPKEAVEKLDKKYGNRVQCTVLEPTHE